MCHDVVCCNAPSRQFGLSLTDGCSCTPCPKSCRDRQWRKAFRSGLRLSPKTCVCSELGLVQVIPQRPGDHGDNTRPH